MALGDRFLDYLAPNATDRGRRTRYGRTALNLDKRVCHDRRRSEIIGRDIWYELAEHVYFHHSKSTFRDDWSCSAGSRLRTWGGFA